MVCKKCGIALGGTTGKKPHLLELRMESGLSAGGNFCLSCYEAIRDTALAIMSPNIK